MINTTAYCLKIDQVREELAQRWAKIESDSLWDSHSKEALKS